MIRFGNNNSSSSNSIKRIYFRSTQFCDAWWGDHHMCSSKRKKKNLVLASMTIWSQLIQYIKVKCEQHNNKATIVNVRWLNYWTSLCFTSVLLILLYRHFYQKHWYFFCHIIMSTSEALQIPTAWVGIEWDSFGMTNFLPQNSTRARFEWKCILGQWKYFVVLWKCSRHIYSSWMIFSEKSEFSRFYSTCLYMWRWPRNQYHWFHWVEKKKTDVTLPFSIFIAIRT